MFASLVELLKTFLNLNVFIFYSFYHCLRLLPYPSFPSFRLKPSLPFFLASSVKLQRMRTWRIDAASVCA